MSQQSSTFRQYLFPADDPRLAALRGLDAYQYREAAKKDAFTGGLIDGWRPLYLNEFRGVTDDGILREELYPLSAASDDERAPVVAMVQAATALLARLDDAERTRIQYAVDAPEWQTWANPEFMQFDTGIRLEYARLEVRDAALAVVEASLSTEGFALLRQMMRINGFLGSTVGLEGIMNEFSYHFALYGTPDLQAPWGWQLFGHHAVANCLVVDGRMVVSPVFLGAEPDRIDDGADAGEDSPFRRRIDLATELMSLLPDELRSRAVTYRRMVDPAMPPGRVHPGDERHLAGAFQDNRVIPYEGVRAGDMPRACQDLLLAIVEEFSALLPPGPRAARLREVRRHLTETWWSWIGGWKPGDVFYFRVQSPVVIAELDHHCGVFLDYDEPKPFHIHTVLRTPHGNDYGRAWVRQWTAGHE